VTTDWREVYRQEKRCPGYVIENGKSITKTHGDDSPCGKVKPSQRDKRKAA
jgi:hypothetical protein